VRTPLEIQYPDQHISDVICTVQALYLLEKINKNELKRVTREYADLRRDNVVHAGLLMLLRYGVYVQYVHPLNLPRLAQQDGGGYASRVWEAAGYEPGVINHKIIHDYPDMRLSAQAILQHAQAHPGQWSQVESWANTTTLVEVAPSDIAQVALESEGDVRHVLMFGQTDAELCLFDPVLGGYTCPPGDIEDYVSGVQIYSNTPL